MAGHHAQYTNFVDANTVNVCTMLHSCNGLFSLSVSHAPALGHRAQAPRSGLSELRPALTAAPARALARAPPTHHSSDITSPSTLEAEASCRRRHAHP